MQPSRKTEAKSSDSEPLTFEKQGGTLRVTNNSEEDSYLIFASTLAGQPKAILFQAGTVEIDLTNVVNVTSFRLVGASAFDLRDERPKPCTLANCPIPPEPPITAAFMVTPGHQGQADGGRIGRIQR